MGAISKRLTRGKYDDSLPNICGQAFDFLLRMAQINESRECFLIIRSKICVIRDPEMSGSETASFLSAS